MLYRRLFPRLLTLLVITSASSLVAQRNTDFGAVGNLTIRVITSDGRPLSNQVSVKLMSGASTTPLYEVFTSSSGVVEFVGIAAGAYHVVVSGRGIEDTDSGQFEVDARKATQVQFVTVRPLSDAKADQSAGSSPLVASADLNVPGSARKQFDNASQAIAHQEWEKARTLLNNAISAYPQYASAYNNLGVVYSHLRDPANARQALEKAISLNDHFASALVNLAKLCLQEQKAAEAETLLDRAAAIEPMNAEALMLLAQAQLLNRHYDSAIASARKVHALPHERLALAHYIAARALERENRPQEAVAELQTFLREEPQGPRAARVREEIQAIQRHQPAAHN